MATISASEARGLYTKMLVDIYRERPVVHSFLRSFFPTVESATRFISIEVMRGLEKVAVDVLRGTEGNRNKFTKSKELTIEPNYYREYFGVTELDIYDRMFGASEVDELTFTLFMEDVRDKLEILVAKIERAYELQCAQALQSGIVTAAEGMNINYNRLAESMVDYSVTNPWSTGANNPITNFVTGGTFIRQKGKAQGGTLNAILGSKALDSLLSNTTYLNRADKRNITLDAIRAPQRDSVGGALHGQLTAGAFNVNLWSYPEFYEDEQGNSIPYIAPENVILLPENPKFKLAFGAVPQLITPENPRVTKGAFVFGEYIDERKHAQDFDVRSAGVAVLTAVDQVFTMKVVPSA